MSWNSTYVICLQEAKTDSLATFVPITDADFTEFANKLNEKVAPHKSSYHYNKFAKALIRHLTSEMKPEVRILNSAISHLVSKH
jgi:hypothetical protein